MGVPVSNQLYFCAKLTYFSKSNVTVISTHYYQDGQPVTSSQPITSTISIDQWIMNYGILGKVLPSKDIAIEIDGGLTYSKFSAGPASLVPGETIPDSPVPSYEMVGLFAGIVLEHRYVQSPLSTFVEAQYNQLWAVTSPHVANYGGLNVSGGVRLYLKAH